MTMAIDGDGRRLYQFYDVEDFQLTVRWKDDDGAVQTLTDVKMQARVRLEDDDPVAEATWTPLEPPAPDPNGGWHLLHLESGSLGPGVYVSDVLVTRDDGFNRILVPTRLRVRRSATR